MSSPTESTFNRTRRARTRVAVEAGSPALPAFDSSDLARGEAAAVLAALARLQLRVDVLAREQSDMFQRLLVAFDDLNARLVWEDDDPSDAVTAE